MFLMVTTVGLLTQQVQAADVPTGTIEGRVLNLSNGQYLSNALLTVDGTNLSVLTNEYGEFTLRNVPAGVAKVTASFTGQDPKTVSVVVTADKTASQDFGLNKAKAVMEDGTVVLDQYVVASQRYKNAQEIAINEERRSANIKDVVATDSLGFIPNGNVGEFVKYIPGVQTEYGAADSFGGAGIGGINPAAASQVSIRGFGSSQTAVTIDGMPMSGVGPAALTRAIGLDMMTINNASRVEVVKVPTPDMDPVSGGTVNLVTKSAFEYAKPTYTIAVSGNYNTSDKLSIHKQPGPANEKTYHTMPSVSLSVAVPVTKEFGFSVSLSRAYNYSANYKIQANWQSTYSTAYGSTTATATTGISTTALVNTILARTTGTRLPLSPYDSVNWTTATFTTSGTTQRATVYYNVGNLADGKLSTLDNPYLRQATDQQNPWAETRNSASFKLDWKPVKGMNLTGSYTGSTYKGINVDRRLQVSINGPMQWGSDYVIGRPYELAVTTGTGQHGSFDPKNALDMEVTSLDKSGVTHTGYLKMTYNYGPWSINASASQSVTNMDLDDLKNGHMYKTVFQAAVGQNIFRNIKDGAPGTIEVYDRSGNIFNYHDLTKWSLNQVDVGTAKSKETARAEEYKLDIGRELDFLPFPSSVKIGAVHTFDKSTKSGLGTGYKIRYTGDTSTTFIDAVADRNFTRTSGLGFAVNQQWGDTYKMYDIYVAHPELFNPDYDVTYSTSNYRSVLNQNKKVREIGDSYYGMLTASFFNKRLTIVTGARQSRTKVRGFQPFNDTKWNYIKNADGTIYRDSIFTQGVKFDNSTNTRADGTTVTDWINATPDNALKARLAAAGIAIPDRVLVNQLTGTGTATTGNNLEAAKRALFVKRVDRSRTDPVTPSVITAYNITNDLVFKPSWSREISKPDLDAGNGQTAGLIGGISINENEPKLAGAGGDGTITISNAGLQPKTVDSFNFQLAWYNKYGKLGANYYYKIINNEWITSTFTRDDPDFLSLMADNGFDGAGTYNNWALKTTDNSFEKSHASGYEFEARENLGFLGNVGGYFNVFANYSHKNIRQSNKDGIVAMPSFASNTYAGGFNVSAFRASFTLKLVHQSEIWDKNQGSVVGYGSDRIQVYGVTPAYYDVKLDFEYQINKVLTFFASADNVLNTQRTSYKQDAAGIIPAYARVTTDYQFGRTINVGLRAQF